MSTQVKEVADSLACCGLVCGFCTHLSDRKCGGCRDGAKACPIRGCCEKRGIRGCWECTDEPCCECSFRSARTLAFLQCAKEEGAAALAEYLLRNREAGIVYHRGGTFQGDYDSCRDEGEVLRLLREGGDPYKTCPTYETAHFTLRLVAESDAGDLLACYTDERARAFINRDNFHYGLSCGTIAEMRNFIAHWLREYRERTLVRFAAVDRSSGKAVGTVEFYPLPEKNDRFGRVGVLRVDLPSACEKEPLLAELVRAAADHLPIAFCVDRVVTKAVPQALERRAALAACGFVPVRTGEILPYDDYFIR